VAAQCFNGRPITLVVENIADKIICFGTGFNGSVVMVTVAVAIGFALLLQWVHGPIT
jgi:hypothetical protein